MIVLMHYSNYTLPKRIINCQICLLLAIAKHAQNDNLICIYNKDTKSLKMINIIKVN